MLNNRMSSRGAPGGPFKGFAAFQETDARSFFGRDETIRRIVARFARATQPPERLVVLIGSSASGKTSLVRAGLIPALRQGALPGSEVWTLDERDISALPQIADLLARMANSSPTPGYFLFIDRFEQVRAHSRAAQIRFCDSTYAALQSGTVRLLLAVSAYAYDDILKILPRDFCDMIRKRTEALLPPQAHDRTEIITGQASVASVTVEASLLPLIVAESGDQPGSLPWLQTTLSRLYEVCDEGLLTLAAYRSFSGLGGLLARQAGEIYGSLDEAGKAAARQLFLRLVDADQQPAARRAPLSDILGLEGEAGRLDDIREVMGRFLSGRLLALDRDPQTAQPTVGLAHDLLIRHWEPLLEWYASVKDDLPYVRRWSADAVEWEQAGRTPDFLATGVRLDQYVFCQQQTDLAFTQRERAFLAESVHERDLRKQQVRDRKEYVSGLEVRSRGATWLLFTVVFLVLALLGGAITLLITRRVGTPVVILPTDTALPATPALVATLPPTLTETPTRAPSQTPTPRPTRTPTHPPSAVPSATPVEISAAPDPESLRLAAEANAILRDKGGSPELAALLAVQSLKISYTTQGDNALAEALVRDYTRRIWAQSAPISQIAYTPDGASLVVASDKVRVLQASTGSVTRELDGRTFSLSGDGKSLVLWPAVGSDLQLIDLQAGSTRVTFAHAAYMSQFALSADGSTLIGGSESGQDINVWDATTGKSKYPSRAVCAKGVDAVAISPRATMYAISCRQGTTILVPETFMTAVKTQGFLLSMAGSTVMQMAFSPDGLWLVAAGSDGVARLWDTATGDELQRFSGHTSRLNSATFSINGVLLLTTSADNTARLWYTQSGELLRVFGGHTGEVIGGAIAPDSFSVTTGGIDRTIRVWDSQYDAAFRRWGNLPGRPSALQFSPDGKRFLVGGSGSQGDGFASVWDTQDGTRLLNLDISYARASEVREALFSPDGTKIGLLGKNQLFVFDAQSGLPLSQMTGKFKTGGLALAFSPDSRSLLVSDATETLVIDPQTNTITKRLPGISGESLILSHDGAFILGLTIGSAAMWNLATGAKIRAFSGAKGAMESFSLSQDGRYLLTGQTDINKQPEANVALLWDVNSARIVRGFVGHSGGVQAVAISPDGRYALTGSVDRTVRLWDVATGTELRELTGHTDSIVSVAFSPDGKYMLTGSDDLTVRLWDTDYRDTLQLACQRLQRDLTQAEQTRFRIPNHRKTC